MKKNPFAATTFALAFAFAFLLALAGAPVSAQDAQDSQVESTAPKESKPAANADEPNWTPLYKGVDVAYREIEEPLMKIFAVRIARKARGVVFFGSPRNPNFKENERETVRQTTADFLDENKLAVAINANFYSPFNAETIGKPGDSNLLGLVVSSGKLVSPPEENWPSFVLLKNGDVGIVQIDPNGDPRELKKIRVAVSGSPIVLQNGEVVKNDDKARHPRTAIGYSQDRKFVYFMTIDGRRSGWSLGATCAEVGEQMKRLGAFDALNLDGGGSTTLVVRGADGTSQILNKPTNSGTKRSLRHNGNSIGVRALPL